MKKIFLLATLCLSLSVTAQKKEKTLAKINEDAISVSEFKKIYEKNLNAIDDDNAKDVKQNLDLYINYKLKVKEAYSLHLDTLNSYKRELETYQNQLTAPYFQDQELKEQLIKEAYNRTKTEIRGSHILIKLPKEATPQDTLKAYKTIMTARDRILDGETFEKVAREVSEDPSVKSNGGDLGYFGAFKMIYLFEDMAYKTGIGEVSMPFKTRFGYHLVTKVDERTSRGEVQVAHILINDLSEKGKATIDSVYTKLQNGDSFESLVEQYSNDISTKETGGVLRKFGSGIMVKDFEDMAFKLETIGDISEPFKTRFGWHIIKLLGKYPIGSFEEMKSTIKDQVDRTNRTQLSNDAIIKRLKREYAILEVEEGKKYIYKENVRTMDADSLNVPLLQINDRLINLKEFVDYISSKRHLPIGVLFENFKNQEVKEYFKDNLVNTDPKYAFALKEYKDGLLLFELMKQKVWDVSKDSVKVENYYKQHIDSYKNKDLKEVKGEVMNDYQKFLEDKWVTDLRESNKVKINKKLLKKLVEYYRKQS